MTEPSGKELQRIVREGERATQTVDTPIKVSWHGAKEASVRLHLEVQSQPEGAFQERVFRVALRQIKAVASLDEVRVFAQ